MGRQIGFYLALEDIEGLLSFIRKHGDHLISKTARPITALDANLKAAFRSRHFGFQAYIWSNGLKRPNINKRTGHIDGHEEVIEFDSGGVDVKTKQLFPGRFFIDMIYLKNHEFARKSDRLGELYSVYRRHIQKTFRKSTNEKPGYFIGPKAYELYKSGWRMGGQYCKILFGDRDKVPKERKPERRRGEAVIMISEAQANRLLKAEPMRRVPHNAIPILTGLEGAFKGMVGVRMMFENMDKLPSKAARGRKKPRHSSCGGNSSKT